jgi:hypothetical protein
MISCRKIKGNIKNIKHAAQARQKSAAKSKKNNVADNPKIINASPNNKLADIICHLLS